MRRRKIKLPRVLASTAVAAGVGVATVALATACTTANGGGEPLTCIADADGAPFAFTVDGSTCPDGDMPVV
jgi:hypothetical protein